MDDRSEVIPAALDGERLDRVVSMVLGCSRADAASLVAAGGAAVDGDVVRAGKQRLVEGQEVRLDPGLLPTVEHPTADPSVEVDVVHVDDDVVVVHKPAGLVVHPGAGHHRGTLVHGLLARFPELATVGDPDRPGIVHRLDRDTTGLLVVARTDLAYDHLVAALAARAVERVYVAMVWGVPEAPRGVIDAPLGRSPRRATRMAVTVEGREARTRYEVRQACRSEVDTALLECRLETGRTHQIRVHLAAIGHPVIGDPEYGGVRDRLPVSRPMLHARRLAFAHPRTGAALAFEAEMPPDMAALVERLCR